MKTRNGLHMRAPAERGKQQPKPPPLRPACEPALATRSPALAVRRDFRHFVTAITGGGWVLCEVKALSHGTKGQSNSHRRAAARVSRLTIRSCRQWSFHMRMRPTYGAAVVFAATLAAPVGSPGPAAAV